MRPPSDWVLRFAPLMVDGGHVLDLACGSGRHLRWLAAQGYRVTGIDRDLSGVEDLRGQPDVELLQIDLETAPPPSLGEARYDGIVVANYLHRPLMPALIQALGPEGVLVYETFAEGHEALGRPRRSAFLLRRGELLETVGGELQVVAFEQGRIDGEAPRIVQRICAVRGATSRTCPLFAPSNSAC